MHTRDQYYDKVSAIKTIANNGLLEEGDATNKAYYENIIQLATQLQYDFRPIDNESENNHYEYHERSEGC